MYTETYGAGRPLVLLHGGYGAPAMFGPVLTALAAGHRVIAPHLRGHGRTPDESRPLSLGSMADDVAEVIEKEASTRQVDVMGFSLGGMVALQTAFRYPELVRRLVVVSAPFQHDGWDQATLDGFEAMTASMAVTMQGTPAYAFYTRPPEEWPGFVGRMGRLLSREYDWMEDLALLSMPVMVVVGDHDSVRRAHAVRYLDVLRDGRLAMLPDTTHYEIAASPLLAATVIPFLRSV
jgi:pimeloyl-ACP methyl ester carboxylesterase